MAPILIPMRQEPPERSTLMRLQNPYDNTASGLTATNVQDAIDEINAAAGTVSLVDNGDGTYDFTDAGGNTTIITDTIDLHFGG